MTSAYPRIAALATATLIASFSLSFAQEDRRVGVTAGYPAAVGVLWQITDRFAIRPDVSWSWSSSESSSTIDVGGGFGTISSASSFESHTTTFGISGLWTIHREDALRVYLGGRAGYSRSTGTNTSTSANISIGFPALTPVVTTTTRTTESRNEGYAASAMFGGQYQLVRRFATFGEIGVTYSSTESDSDNVTRLDTKVRSASLRSGVGVILFF